MVLLLTLPSFSGKKKVNIWMIGDSTMAQKKPERAPESGWGEAMKQLVTDKALVHNHAASGRSSRSFIAQKRWENVLDSVQKGDFVIIQFGHNDEKSDTLLYYLSDGFLTIPGGVGTMDELWEAISWAQLGYHAKPVGLLNAAGFYNELIAFNRKMVEVGFIRPAHAGIMIVDAGLDELLDKMATYEPHKTIFAMKAENL